MLVAVGVADAAEGFIDLADGADALEGLDLGEAGEFVEGLLQGRVVEEVVAENLLQLGIWNKWRENNVREEAFRTVTAPLVFLAADIAALENGKILRILRETLGNLQLVERTQVTVIVVTIAHPVMDVIAEVGLELQRLGVLVVDVGAGDSRLVRTRLVREGHVADAGNRAQQHRVEG